MKQKITIKEFRKMIKEVVEDAYKKSHDPFMPNDEDAEQGFSLKKVWNGVSVELQHQSDYNEALSKVLDDVAEEDWRHEYTKGVFSS